MDYATFSTAIGLLGVALYLGSYGALQLGMLRGNRELYVFLNMAAAACVLFDLQRNFNLPSVLIQVSWIIISLIGLLRIRRRKRRIQCAAETAWLGHAPVERSLFRMEAVGRDFVGSHWNSQQRYV